MHTYKLKEIFYTLQGEGYHTGRPAVFCRFTGCNLWSGREEDRSDAVCSFCDTDFVGMDGNNGGRYTTDQLIEKIYTLWPNSTSHPFIVCTGGEPALQMDEELIRRLHSSNIEIAVETNGTKPLPEDIDWICVSPKEDATLHITMGNEIKLVYPQKKNHPSEFDHLPFDHFYLQPLDDHYKSDNTQACLAYCLAHPKWKLSLQTHKILGIE